MDTGEKRSIKIGFPFNLYFKQLFLADTYARFINPFRFWRKYQINHLETCRELDIVQNLERCRKLDYRFAKPTKIELEQDYKEILTNSIFQQAELNTIYIFIPSIKLKYRGVSYYSRNILNININIVEVDPNRLKLNSLKCTNDSNNASTSKKSGNN